MKRITVNYRNFIVKKDWFGNWSIWNADHKFEPIPGAPAFSVGHRTQKDAVKFLKGFEE